MKKAYSEEKREKAREYFRKYRAENREKFNEQARAYRLNNLDKHKEQERKDNKKYYLKNREKEKARSRATFVANPKQGYEKINRWRKNNKGRYADLVKKKYLMQKEATPRWLSFEDKNAIEYIKLLARIKTKITGTVHVVDHVVPIQGENVRGLHVPWNLQILTRSENSRKSNKVGY